jgi:hypothetical protein
MIKSKWRTTFLVAPTVLHVWLMCFLGLAAQAIVFLRLRRLGKRGHDLMTIESVNRSGQLSQNLLIFAPFTTDPNGARIKAFCLFDWIVARRSNKPAPHSDGRDGRAPASQIQGKWRTWESCEPMEKVCSSESARLLWQKQQKKSVETCKAGRAGAHLPPPKWLDSARWKLALDVFRGVNLLIREPLMKCISFAVFLAVSLAVLLFPRQVAAVQVTLILQNIVLQNVAIYDFDEWKVESKQKCTQTTGKIRRDTDAFEQTWYVGDPGHDIRFWWSRLSGEADATVLVNNIVVFRGHCLHNGSGKVRMIDTCAYPSVYRTGGPGPYLIEQPDINVTYIHFATSMLPERFYNR